MFGSDEEETIEEYTKRKEAEEVAKALERIKEKVLREVRIHLQPKKKEEDEPAKE